MKTQSKPISEAELTVLKLLWEQGPSTVREVREVLRARQYRWAHNTVLTLLSRLRDKHYVTSQRKGTANVFQAAVSKHRLLKLRLQYLTERICDGTASPLVHALVDSQRLTEEDVAELRAMLDQLPAGAGQRKAKSTPGVGRAGTKR